MNVKIELSSDMLAAIDRRRGKDPALPPRTAMIRTLITAGLAKMAEDDLRREREENRRRAVS